MWVWDWPYHSGGMESIYNLVPQEYVVRQKSPTRIPKAGKPVVVTGSTFGEPLLAVQLASHFLCSPLSPPPCPRLLLLKQRLQGHDASARRWRSRQAGGGPVWPEPAAYAEVLTAAAA